MTDEAKALVRWLRSMRSPHTGPAADLIETQAREIEQHEAFRQEVSDAVEETLTALAAHGHCAEGSAHDRLSRFIIVKPKPDPLEGVLTDAGYAVFPDDLVKVRAALAKRGLQVTEIER